MLLLRNSRKQVLVLVFRWQKCKVRTRLFTQATKEGIGTVFLQQNGKNRACWFIHHQPQLKTELWYVQKEGRKTEFIFHSEKCINRKWTGNTYFCCQKIGGQTLPDNGEVFSTVNLGFASGIQIPDLVVGCLHFFWEKWSRSKSKMRWKYINTHLTNPIFSQMWTNKFNCKKPPWQLPNANARWWEYCAEFCLKAWRWQLQKWCKNMQEWGLKAHLRVILGRQRVNNL